MNPLLPQDATVLEVNEEFPGTRTLKFELPDSRLIDGFQPGQFNMIGLEGYGEAPVVFSSIESGTVASHTVRSAGRVTQALTRLGAGDRLQIRGPFGSGWPLEELKGRDLVLMVGGMGIIPLRILMQRLLEKREEYGGVLVLYGAREPGQMLFAGDVLSWADHPGVKVRLTVDRAPAALKWGHHVGVVTELLAHPSRGAPGDVALICGPELMMRFSVRELLVRGMPASRLYVSLERHMKCGIGHCGHCQLGPHYVCKDGPVLAYNKIEKLPDTLF